MKTFAYTPKAILQGWSTAASHRVHVLADHTTFVRQGHRILEVLPSTTAFVDDDILRECDEEFPAMLVGSSDDVAKLLGKVSDTFLSVTSVDDDAMTPSQRLAELREAISRMAISFRPVCESDLTIEQRAAIVDAGRVLDKYATAQ